MLASDAPHLGQVMLAAQHPNNRDHDQHPKAEGGQHRKKETRGHY